MTAQPLVQFRAVTLNPAPDGSVIRLQTALGEQLLDIAQRERVAQIPAHGAQNQLGLRLPPLKDLRSGCVIHGRCRLPADPAKVATHPLIARYEEETGRTKNQLIREAGSAEDRRRVLQVGDSRENLLDIAQKIRGAQKAIKAIEKRVKATGEDYARKLETIAAGQSKSRRAKK